MPEVKTNGLTIAYETFGDPSHRSLVLIEGLGSQMIFWPAALCRQLAASHHYVVRFDNRDVGLSSKMEGTGLPDILQLRAQLRAGKPLEVPYLLLDMAADTLGLMDALRIEKAHVCGISMGGMIAQTMAIMSPRRMLSLISLESTTGASDLPPPRPGVGEALLEPAPADREGFIAYSVNLNRLFAGGSDYYDPSIMAAKAAAAYDRCYYPDGIVRQYAAIMASGSRREELADVAVPTLVVHGDADTLLPWEHGQDTANAIRGARLVLINGLGHGTAYPGLWEQMAAVMVEHMLAVEAQTTSL
jgi:pimeloyl-ACP methyl ester carboxylesterase